MKSPFRNCIYLAAAAGLLTFTGCAHYHPLPLPIAADLADGPTLSMPLAQLRLPGLRAHPIPSGGLDEATVMALAVLNNPDLKAARLQAGVAGAQSFQAGLLPDPVLDTGFAASTLNYGGALGLSQDIQAILVRASAERAARAAAKQVNLSILWQEIQVAERARELFIQAHANSQLQPVLDSNRRLLESNYRRERAAMEQGDATAGSVAADLTLLANADTAVRRLQTGANLVNHEIHALLGIKPGAPLHLLGTSSIKPLSQAAFDRAVAALPRRRVDLLALQDGYKSQEATLRRAILAQFPTLRAGVNLDRDPVEGVNSFGPEVSLTLPLFNRNRGQIAVARATRVMLRQRYQAQLDSVVSQADQVWSASRITAAQLHDLDAQLPILDRTTMAAEQSFHRNDLGAALYVDLRASELSKRAEAIRLRESLEEARSALDTLLGLPFSSP